MLLTFRLAATFIFTIVSATSAFAGNISQYTTYNLDKCKVLEASNEAEEWGGSKLCKGFKGNNIYFAEGDLRTLIAFGNKPQDHCAAHQSLSGFNSANPKVEWRLAGGKPIAAIQRWSESYDPSDSEKQRTWLVITKLEGNNSCHMAYVAGSFPNANAKAREIADTMTQNFLCKGGRPKTIADPSIDITAMPSDGCQ